MISNPTIEGAACGIAALDEIQHVEVQRFQPAWATRAHLRAELGCTQEAAQARAKAISLTTEPGVRRYLQRIGSTH